MPDYTEKLKSFNNIKLIDVVKNYKQYNYDESLRKIALDILNERGVSEEDLKLSGNFENSEFKNAEGLYRNFRKYSRTAFICYLLIFGFEILGNFLDTDYATLTKILLICSFTALLLYFVFLIKSILTERNFYNSIGKKQGLSTVLIYIFIGMPFYFLMYFYFNKHLMKDEMMMIR